MKKILISVLGMTCNHCEKRLEDSLGKIEGIEKVKASFKDGLITIYYSLKKPSITSIKNSISDLGYKYKKTEESLDTISKRTSFKELFPILLFLLFIYILVGIFFGFDFINFIPKIDKTVSLSMLFVIGLLTSIHCIGMCGSINLAVSVSKDNKVSIKRPLLYNVGRVISYTIIGFIVGGIGSVLGFNSMVKGIVILITSILMMMMGLSMIGWLPKSLHKFLPKAIFKINNKQTSNKTPFIAGLLNGLMPCGPLQAMQLYALSTGSILMGGLSMFLFALGTVPLIFAFGILFTSLKGKHHFIIQRISSILIIILSLFMFSRAFTTLGIDIVQNVKRAIVQNQYKEYVIAEIKDGIQYVEIELNSKGYTPILVEKNIPVVFNIKAKNIQFYGCTNSIKIPELGITKDLENGDNIVKFTPTKTGDIMYSCWMGMVTSDIKVVESIKEIKKDIGE